MLKDVKNANRDKKDPEQILRTHRNTLINIIDFKFEPFQTHRRENSLNIKVCNQSCFHQVLLIDHCN